MALPEAPDGYHRLDSPVESARRDARASPAGARARPLRVTVQRPALRGAYGAPCELRSGARAALGVAVDQDGRLPGRLRVLPASGTLSHGCGKAGAARA